MPDVRKHIFFPKLQTLGSKAQGGLQPNECQLSQRVGPERMAISWGQTQAETPREAEGRPPALVGWGRGTCWVAQLPPGLKASRDGQCCSPEEGAQPPVQQLDVILTAFAIKTDQGSQAQPQFVYSLTLEALPCLLSVDFSSLVRLPGTPSILA